MRDRYRAVYIVGKQLRSELMLCYSLDEAQYTAKNIATIRGTKVFNVYLYMKGEPTV